jgi:hypothetical protein
MEVTDRLGHSRQIVVRVGEFDDSRASLQTSQGTPAPRSGSLSHHPMINAALAAIAVGPLAAMGDLPAAASSSPILRKLTVASRLIASATWKVALTVISADGGRCDALAMRRCRDSPAPVW